MSVPRTCCAVQLRSMRRHGVSSCRGRTGGAGGGPGLSANHVSTPVDYEQSPPVGGDHASAWLNCGVYTEPVPNENAVHALEHGAAWVAYDSEALSQEQVDALRTALPDAYVVLAPTRAWIRPSCFRPGRRRWRWIPRRMNGSSSSWPSTGSPPTRLSPGRPAPAASTPLVGSHKRSSRHRPSGPTGSTLRRALLVLPVGVVLRAVGRAEGRLVTPASSLPVKESAGLRGRRSSRNLQG